MANTYLNKNVKFQCQFGNAVWFNAQNGDNKVKIRGADALMDDCRLNLIGGPRPGQCNLFIDPSTGAPGACAAVSLSGTWNNNSRVQIGEQKILSGACSISCSRNGSIKPFKPTLLSINVNDDARAEGVSITLESDAQSKENDNRQVMKSKTDQDNGQSYEANHSYETNQNYEANEKYKANQNIVNEESEEERNIEYALCNYKNCSMAKECEYLHTSYILKETNESKNAAELKINMGKDAFDLYAGECSIIETSLYGSYMYSIAHHHIIPVNQCFKNFPEIVKLANFYRYNINKAKNGISLPTMNTGYDKQPFELKKEIAFMAMKHLGKQWHKGGHRYSCKISAEIDGILTKPFLHYKDAVDRELTSLNIKYNNELRCRVENYEQQAEEFSAVMDYICEKVARKLRRFEDEPKKSYPCFISRIAFFYAYYEELAGYENEIFGKEG